MVLTFCFQSKYVLQCAMQYNFHWSQQSFQQHVAFFFFVDLFYIPSFLRGHGDNRMTVLEPRRSVGRPRCSQGKGMTVLTHRSQIIERACWPYQRPGHHPMITTKECMQHTLLHPVCYHWTPFPKTWDLVVLLGLLEELASLGSNNIDKWIEHLSAFLADAELPNPIKPVPIKPDWQIQMLV